MCTASHQPESTVTSPCSIGKKKRNHDNNYIAKFEHLQNEAEWGTNEVGTITKFRSGLYNSLHCAILEKVQPCPVTLQGWINTTCRQHELWAKVHSSLSSYQNKPTPMESQKWCRALGRSQDGRWVGVKKEDRMDVNAIQVNALTVEERQKLQKEG
jgi:hypothetical protein